MSETTVEGKPKKPKPVPQPAPESMPYWQAAKEHRLELPKCNACGKFWFPPSQSCPHCFAADFVFKPVPGLGKVFSFVMPQHPQYPWFEYPYIVALVELDEGTRLVTNLVDVTPEAASVGMRVEVRYQEFDGDLVLPLFAPVSAP